METESDRTKAVDEVGSGVKRLIEEAAIAPIGGLYRAVSTVNRDFRTIADSVRVLPAMLETLASINRQVASIDTELSRVRSSVDRIHEEIATLTGHVDDLESSMHPLGRIRSRLSRSDAGEDHALGSPPEGGGDEGTRERSDD